MTFSKFYINKCTANFFRVPRAKKVENHCSRKWQSVGLSREMSAFFHLDRVNLICKEFGD